MINCSAKTIIITKKYNPRGSNINSIDKKHVPIITDNPNLIEKFPKDSIFLAYKKFSNLKDLILGVDAYSLAPLKEIDEDRCCSYWIKKCDACKNLLTIYHLSNVLQHKNLLNIYHLSNVLQHKKFVNHISSFQCFAT